MKLLEIETATERLRQEPSVCSVFLHGSAAQGRLRPDSDIDIAILPAAHTHISTQTRLMLAGELESLLGRTVDIGILSTNNLIYA